MIHDLHLNLPGEVELPEDILLSPNWSGSLLVVQLGPGLKSKTEALYHRRTLNSLLIHPLSLGLSVSVFEL